MPDRLPFPQVVDNTALAEFADCEKLFYFDQIRRIRPKGQSIHLDWGAAFAKGLETMRRAFYEEGKSQEDAEAIGAAAALSVFQSVNPTDTNKDITALLRALEAYGDQWPFETDPLQPADLSGKLGIEFNFAVPLPVNHPETGDPILFAGRADMLGSLQGQNSLFITDEKTKERQSYNPLYELRSQFMAYSWAARQYGHNVAGCIIREVIVHKGDIQFNQNIVIHPEWSTDRWFEQAISNLQRAVDCWRRDKWQFNFATRCGSFGGCPYTRLCIPQNPEPWIQIDYRVNTWNPLTREETPA